MTGTMNRGGTVTIALDCFEKLEAPASPDGERRHWLPCEACGALHAVAWNVVSHVCEGCAADDAYDRATMSTPQGAWDHAAGYPT
jgi:hypothetical protein